MSDWQRVADAKSLWLLKAMACIYCLNIKVTRVVHLTLSSFLPFVSLTGLQIKKPYPCHVGHDIALNRENYVLMCPFII